MRRFLVIGAVTTVVLVGWLLLDADPDGRQDLVDRIADAFGDGGEAEETAPPNWGDVATKVGEFTEEERALRSVLEPALSEEAESVGAEEDDGDSDDEDPDTADEEEEPAP